MTEEEAREKWCPFVRYSSHNGESINRWARDGEVQMSPEPAKCIASACMAWRGRQEPIEWQTMPPSAAGDSGTQYPIAWRSAGFCGLAGEPQ